VGKFIITFGSIAAVIAAYVYLDWSILQILGAVFLLMFAFVSDEKGPIWRKTLWVVLVLLLMVLGHFMINDNVMYWGAILLSALLFIISFFLLMGLINPESGAGSVLTVYFLGVIILTPIAVWTLYTGLNGLGYW